MYVGNGLIAESRPSAGFYFKRHSGVGVDYLIKRAQGSELLILRLKSELWDEFRFKAANYILIECAAGKQRYGWGRLLQSATSVNIKVLPRGVICSELILEALAIGGSALVPEFHSHLEKDGLFLPASFSKSDKFDRIVPSYLEVVD